MSEMERESPSKEENTDMEKDRDRDRERESERQAYFESLSWWIRQATASLLLQHCLMMSPPPPQPSSGTSQPLLAQGAGNAGEQRREIEYVIPSFWKRIFAEQIDFYIMFVLKGIIIVIIHDYFEIINFEFFDLILKSVQDDYDFSIDVTWELVLMDLMMRFLTCLLETICLAVSHGNRPGGTTPGKALFGLRVITATSIVRVENRAKETVVVHPGTTPSFKTSLGRTITKNSLIPFLLPMFTPFFFPHNRTVYDVYWNCIVVQEVDANRNRVR